MKFLNTSRILPEKEKPMYLQSLISLFGSIVTDRLMPDSDSDIVVRNKLTTGALCITLCITEM